MIHGRILIDTQRSDYLGADGLSDVDSYNDAVMAEIYDKAAAIASAQNVDSVRVEVEYPGEVWAVSGDALEVTFDPPSMVTLPPYAEVAP